MPDVFDDLDWLLGELPGTVVSAYGAGETILRPELPNDAVWMMRRGAVRTTRRIGAGRVVTVALNTPGELFGAVSFIDRRPWGMTTQALTAAEVVRIPLAVLRERVSRDAEVAAALLERTVADVLQQHARLIELGSLDVHARLVRALLRLENLAGERPALSQDELASIVGASRESVVLALRGLRAAGVVETGRKRVAVLDVDGLRALI